jgi:heme exporter protein D
MEEQNDNTMIWVALIISLVILVVLLVAEAASKGM